MGTLWKCCLLNKHKLNRVACCYFSLHESLLKKIKVYLLMYLKFIVDNLASSIFAWIIWVLLIVNMLLITFCFNICFLCALKLLQFKSSKISKSATKLPLEKWSHISEILQENVLTIQNVGISKICLLKVNF